MGMAPASIFFTIAILALTLREQANSGCLAQGYVNPRNPCHEKKGLGDQNTCLTYVLPPQLCSKCVLKDAGPVGKFPDCKSIYDITRRSCRTQLKKYARRNRCDGLRRAQIKDFDNNVESLDFFIYAICEACCDCVTVGAEEVEFDEREKTGTLFDVAKRVNCGTHPAVDICNVWPNVRTVVSRKDERPAKAVAQAMPEICPVLKTWRDARIRNDGTLSDEQRDTVPQLAQEFMNNFVNRAACNRPEVWRRCVSLERNQSRI